jgi:uncharacterized protein YjbI with pentapeptide repeats
MRRLSMILAVIALVAPSAAMAGVNMQGVNLQGVNLQGANLNQSTRASTGVTAENVRAVGGRLYLVRD